MASFLRGLRGFVRSLPSDEEKAELLKTLREARTFLDEVESLVEAIPSLETNAELSHAMSRLDGLVARTNNNAGLAKAMGFTRRAAPNAATLNGPADIDLRATALQEKIGALDRSEITRTLEASGETMVVLKALATGLRLPLRSGERKSVLIRRIASHVENERGYRLLQGDGGDAVENGGGDGTP